MPVALNRNKTGHGWSWYIQLIVLFNQRVFFTLLITLPTLFIPKLTQAHSPPQEFTLAAIFSYTYSTMQAQKGNYTPAYIGTPFLITSTYAAVDEIMRQPDEEERTKEGDKLNKREKEVGDFLHIRGEIIRIEMARGHGDNLNSLASLWGCPAYVWPRFGRMTQRHYLTLSKTVDEAEKDEVHHTPPDVSAFKAAMLQEPAVKAACNAVSAG